MNAPLPRPTPRRRRRVGLETLEDRRVLSTIAVTSLASTGPGSLRWAIVQANSSPGPDEIDFAVPGTIKAGRSALPAITGPTTIDGTSAPGFAGAPVVTVDLQGARGLRFARGADGSTLSSLSIVRSGGDGVTLDASNVTVQGNYIGLLADGSTIAANRGDGVRINAGSRGNLIGREDPGTPQAFQLSNVISGNGGDGVGVYGGSDSRIAMNFIGTDASGTVALGNRGNGVLLTQGAARNVIGGAATGGNDPTAGVFVRPPQGNLISGNRGNGVLINGRSTRNVLSGNFIGTDASGDSALGNRLDGVAIDGADDNDLIGCTIQDSPFVFYNVLSGNGGNGLRVTNSNDVTVHANFMGVGADNATVVANRGDGLLVSGRSQNTQVGGVIPLGNVISGNDRNGIEVRDQASGFVSFNTFGGVFAFGGAAPNRGDGILITSSGGDNQIRTSIISGNLGDGIELGGRATGVQVTDTAAGTNTAINAAIPNGGSGIKLSGRARGNAIGGFQPSVEPRVTASANGRYGIEVVGSARDNLIFNTYVGTGARQTTALGNALGGVYLGPGTSGTSIGGTGEGESILIANNGGDGVTIVSARNNRVVGNRILGNAGYGLRATGDVRWTVLRDNQVADNAAGGVDVTDARGIITT
ncbi:MAG: hypothetical protein BGO49_28650 [Planctomycetales bacterium 71-10]|nr:MAG: hypothetical protein BGO49_28650 [Planctomycetales bacterium 71-10]